MMEPLNLEVDIGKHLFQKLVEEAGHFFLIRGHKTQDFDLGKRSGSDTEFGVNCCEIEAVQHFNCEKLLVKEYFNNGPYVF